MNLSIASTVVRLYGRSRRRSRQARGGALAARKDVSPRIVVEREVQRYSAMLEVPEMAPMVLSADLRDAQAMATALTPELNRMRSWSAASSSDACPPAPIARSLRRRWQTSRRSSEGIPKRIGIHFR